MFEKLSYFFFKRRLNKKLRSLYEMEDPWGGAFLSGIFSPLIRKHMLSLPSAIQSSPVLDAGGGEASYYVPLADLISEYHLVDTNLTALERARKITAAGRVKLIQQSLDAFRPAPEFYGTLWLIGILTYLGAARHPKTVRTILERLWTSLKPGGLAVLIHPYYSESELLLLNQFSSSLTAFGGFVTYNENRDVGNQHFMIDLILKK